MVHPSEVHTELEEQRCLIEQQQYEMHRTQRKIELLHQLTAALQSEVDCLRAELQATRRKASDAQEQLSATLSNSQQPAEA